MNSPVEYPPLKQILNDLQKECERLSFSEYFRTSALQQKHMFPEFDETMLFLLFLINWPTL